MFYYSMALLECLKADLTRVMADRKGVTALEYGVIAAGIVAVVAVAATALGTRLSTLFGTFIPA